MVEFGLKLEDNRVAEWANKYIDYNKLKLLIEKLSELIKKRKELENRNPNLSRVIREEILQSPKSEKPFDTPRSSQTSLASIKDESNEKVTLLSSHYANLMGEGDSLSPPHFAVRRDVKRSSSYGSVKEALQNVAYYFKPNSFEDKLRNLYKNEETCKEVFAQQLIDEIEKVKLFYVWKCKEIREEFQVLMESVPSEIRSRKPDPSQKFSTRMLLLKSVRNISNSIDNFKSNHQSNDEEYNSKSFRVKEEDSIQRAIIDLHRTSKLLLNFTILNYTGFVKIIKKYRKKTEGDKKNFQDDLNNVNKDGREAEILANDMELNYARWFCGGNIREAQVQMLPKKGDNLDMDWSQLRLGYRLGMCAVLTVWICWDCIHGYMVYGNTSIGGRSSFPVFRGCGGLLVFHWFWGFSTFIWARFRVNYIYLFDFNPKIVETPFSIIGDVVDETLVYLILMLLYYKAGAHDMPALLPTETYPFMLILYTVKKLIFPLRTRVPLWKAISVLMTAPLNSSTFFQTYVGDVFTSMVKVFQDLLWIICFVFSGDFLLSEEDLGNNPHAWQDAFWYKHVAIPLICLAPLWFRFNQCLRRYYDTNKRFPHLANAFKYALSQCVTLFGAFHPLYLMHYHTGDNIWGTNLFQIFWTGLFVSSSLYSWCWDVYMDWGLGRMEYAMLGPRLMFPKKICYYLVIVADLFLRFMWVLTLIPPQSGAKFELPYYLSAINMVVELFRRTIWGFFRLENEHRFNTSQFRRVDFVPLHFDTGHSREYKKKEEKRGWTVLAEVFAVTVAVIAISISSIVAARNATANTDTAV